MGTFRTLLAISVLITHSGPIFGVKLLNGDMAIHLFFVISGFLMSLILSEKYSNVRLFYVNRVLRIFPPFWSAVVFTIVLGTIAHTPPLTEVSTLLSHYREAGNWWAVAYAYISNVFLVGGDVGSAIGSEDFSKIVISFSDRPDHGFNKLLLVPQSWTLPLELSFYALAPFVLRLRSVAILALCLGLVLFSEDFLRYFDHQGIKLATDGLLPFQFQFFIFGVLAYRLYDSMRDRLLQSRSVCWAGTILAFSIVFFGYPAVKLLHMQPLTLYVGATLCVPFLFALTNGSSFDSFVGEFSYPVYLFHVAIAQWLVKGGFESWGLTRITWGPATLVLTLSLSFIYLVVIDRRIGSVRARIAALAKARPIDASPLLPPMTTTAKTGDALSAAE
jgi:peptidoglycan/LPS O-acetylase OafA/YrhL